jgi:hypothetical protein
MGVELNRVVSLYFVRKVGFSVKKCFVTKTLGHVYPSQTYYLTPSEGCQVGQKY